MDCFVVCFFAVYTDAGNCRWVDHMLDIPENGFENQDIAGYFNTAGGGARAAADEHEQGQNHSGKSGPSVVIRYGVSRCGDYGNHVEEGLAQIFSRVGVEVGNIYSYRYT